jgi:hypothetical protein
MDLIVQLPQAIDFDGTPRTAILVVVDRLTKRAQFFPCNDTVTATDIAGTLHQKVFPFMGYPGKLSLTVVPNLHPRSLKSFVNSSIFALPCPPHTTHRQTDRQNKSISC